MDKLLIKIPTKDRGYAWVGHYTNNVRNENTRIYLTEDITHSDQKTLFHNGSYYSIYGQSKNKIDAYNRDINFISQKFDWDVILLGSDDMWPNTPGFDQIILEDMNEHFPDGDGCLWYNTENSLEELRKRYRGKRSYTWGDNNWQRDWICMLPIMGRKYYERFGYVYHPSYQSFWCDNEQTEVAKKLGKIKAIDRTIIRHQHPSWDAAMPADSLYTVNNANWNNDMQNFRNRQRKGFPI